VVVVLLIQGKYALLVLYIYTSKRVKTTIIQNTVHIIEILVARIKGKKCLWEKQVSGVDSSFSQMICI